jgi:antitoxin Phd
MTRVPASQARENFAELVNEVAFGRKRLVLHRHGKDVVAMIPIEDLELLEELEDQLDVAAAKRALADKAPRVPWGKAKAELGLK